MANVHWYDHAVMSLEDDLEEGYLTQDEFNKEMRELNAELQQATHDAAEDAANNYY